MAALAAVPSPAVAWRVRVAVIASLKASAHATPADRDSGIVPRDAARVRIQQTRCGHVTAMSLAGARSAGKSSHLLPRQWHPVRSSVAADSAWAASVAAA